ncbi:hypothetical protein A3K93_04135 [Acinetobacter sp. NCu2D-2]|nr:hypothetical protein [Acinetobacter sp. NCu2D-2]ANF83091.1 hypothetical protein A3K93_04135 [Acinetobacter sp. NCu2D-2]
MSAHQPRSLKKLLIFGTLGLCVPIFLVTMAFLAVSSDAKNQEKYKQQQAEMLARMEARKATENFTAEEESAASENH